MEAIISGMIESIICNPFAGSAGSPADFYFVTLQVFYHVKSLISVGLIFATHFLLNINKRGNSNLLLVLPTCR